MCNCLYPFLMCLWLSPLAETVPSFATAPALIYVAVLMARGLSEIDWQDLTEAAPAFITLTVMPFTYSIANGIALGFISYALVKLFSGRAREVKVVVWAVAAIWIAKFIYLGV